MKYILRLIEPQLLRAAAHFGALILTGPRRSGKTTLLRKLFPRASYHLLEDPDIISRLRAFVEGDVRSKTTYRNGENRGRLAYVHLRKAEERAVAGAAGVALGYLGAICNPEYLICHIKY